MGAAVVIERKCAYLEQASNRGSQPLSDHVPLHHFDG